MRKIFIDKDGKFSSKRFLGFLACCFACVCHWRGVGEPETTRIIFIIGGSMISAGVLEHFGQR